MKEKPTLSISMIAYHHCAYLRRALDSILSQETSFSFEVIVCDDCSNDGSEEILLEYARRYSDIVTIVINETNLGVSANSLKAWGLAKGKYQMGFEGDDFLIDCHYFQDAIDYLEAHPEVPCVGAGTVGVDPKGHNPIISQTKCQLGKYYSFKDYARFGFTIHGNTLIRRADIIDCQSKRYQSLKLSVPTMGDVITRCLIYDKGPIYVLPRYVHAHRSGAENPTSFSHATEKAIDYTEMYLAITKALEDYFNDGRSYRTLYLNRVAGVTLNVIMRKTSVSPKDWRKYCVRLTLIDRVRVFIKMVRKCCVILLRKIAASCSKDVINVEL